MRHLLHKDWRKGVPFTNYTMKIYGPIYVATSEPLDLQYVGPVCETVVFLFGRKISWTRKVA